MKFKTIHVLVLVLTSFSCLGTVGGINRQNGNAQQASAARKPNILVIMGDDVGWFNIGAYHQGIMSGKTVNLRQDPFERTPSIRGETLNEMGGGYMNDFFAREFWCFVQVQQEVAKLAQTAIDYPPMQAPASFNLDAIKAKIQETLKEHESQLSRVLGSHRDPRRVALTLYVGAT